MKYIFVSFYLLIFQLHAQEYSKTNFGVSTGLLFEFGSHVRSVGINLKSYYTDYFAQVNAGISIKYNIGSYGQRKNFWETRNTIGLVLLAGKKENSIDFLLDGLNHQSAYNYGIGFNYLFYIDNAGTSQLSGGWSIHLKKVAVYFENDVFGGEARDRFRSGHFVLSYRGSEFRFYSGIYIWTGETRGSIWHKESRKGSPNGYRSLFDLPYGKTSHGIAYGGLMLNALYGNQISLKMGYDSEEIRHFVQNRISHDLVLLPKRVKRNTPHYPRLGSDGGAVFRRRDRRRDCVYFQGGYNSNITE